MSKSGSKNDEIVAVYRQNRYLLAAEVVKACQHFKKRKDVLGAKVLAWSENKQVSKRNSSAPPPLRKKDEQKEKGEREREREREKKAEKRGERERVSRADVNVRINVRRREDVDIRIYEGVASAN